jgi:hypothetical protein
MGWLLDAATTEAVAFLGGPTTIPADWLSFSVHTVITNQSTTPGNVMFQAACNWQADADVFTLGGFSAPPAATVPIVATTLSAIEVFASVDASVRKDRLNIVVRRNASVAGDTYPNDIVLVGVRLKKLEQRLP